MESTPTNAVETENVVAEPKREKTSIRERMIIEYEEGEKKRAKIAAEEVEKKQRAQRDVIDKIVQYIVERKDAIEKFLLDFAMQGFIMREVFSIFQKRGEFYEKELRVEFLGSLCVDKLMFLYDEKKVLRDFLEAGPGRIREVFTPIFQALNDLFDVKFVLKVDVERFEVRMERDQYKIKNSV